MQVTAFIISGGRISDPGIIRSWMEKEAAAVVICADGGARYAEDIGVVPSVVIGDMDSIDEKHLTSLEEKGSLIIRYSRFKDETDTELALNYALTLKPRLILLFGAIGTRIDHSLANIFLLAGAVPEGVELRIIDDRCEIFLVTDKASVRGRSGQTVSLIPFSPLVSGITLRGFEYPLRDADMKMGLSLGISNRLTGTEGFIEVKSGRLIVVNNFEL
ncbi:MAG: thiamine diphosphokinase [Syntrophales bacterium]|nr:thiamine diphosphokinase [Syntrophales bacterium]